MMIFLYYAFLSIAFILFQTSVMPEYFLFNQSFDINIAIILCLSLVQVRSSVVLGITVLGCVMDSISGGPFGLYISAYLWIYIIVQIFKQFVHSENFIFILAISGIAVLLENIFLLFSFFIRQGSGVFMSPALVSVVQQMLLAFICVPVLIVVIHVLKDLYSSIFQRLLAKQVKLNE